MVKDLEREGAQRGDEGNEQASAGSVDRKSGVLDYGVLFGVEVLSVWLMVYGVGCRDNGVRFGG